MMVSFDELKGALERVTQIVSGWPNIVEVNAPCTVVADIHGDGDALWHIMRNARCEGNMVFMGDICDRGQYSVESLFMVLEAVRDGKAVYLRGNHEDKEMAMAYGLGEELKAKFGEDDGSSLILMVDALFSALPLAAVCEGWFIVHGGISYFSDLYEVSSRTRFISRPADDAQIEALLWSDPGETDAFNEERGAGYTFTADALRGFLDRHGLIGMIRGHQVYMKGYAVVFEDPPCICISSSFVVAADEFAAILEIDREGTPTVVQMTRNDDDTVGFTPLTVDDQT